MEARPITSRSNGWLARLIVLAALVSVGAWTLLTLSPRLDVDRDSGFDTERAMAHLEFIARDPRPLGSPHHRAVREYLIREFRSLGLYVDVQDTRVSHPRILRGLPIQIINIIARLPGTQGERGKAVMLAAHYDSTHLNAAASRGAGDDGAAVAALLEVARLLAEDPPVNDVIFLITDGEERGLLGARAFVNEHHWFDEVGVVFNFEARGTSGPSLMFQTSWGNGWLIEQYARVAPQPRSSSIGYEIYRLMPNDTDFTIFRNAGLQGLNFAFIGDYQNYHTAGDTIENLDLRSMRHHGVQALALARHFGNLPLSALPETDDAIYFNVGTLGVVRYPQRWSLPLAIGAAVVCLVAISVAARRRIIRARGVLASLGVMLLNLIVVVALAWGALRTASIEMYQRNVDLSIGGFAALAFLATLVVLMLLGRRAGIADLAGTALLAWTVLAVVAAAYVPAASYLVIWPALFGSVALLLVNLDFRPPLMTLVSIILALPLVLLLTPLTYLAFLGLRIQLAPIVVTVVVVGMWGLLPYLLLTSRLAPKPIRAEMDSDYSAVSGGGGA